MISFLCKEFDLPIMRSVLVMVLDGYPLAHKPLEKVIFPDVSKITDLIEKLKQTSRIDNYNIELTDIEVVILWRAFDVVLKNLDEVEFHPLFGGEKFEIVDIYERLSSEKTKIDKNISTT